MQSRVDGQDLSNDRDEVAEIREVVIRSGSGIRVALTNVGAAIRSIVVPTGNRDVDVVLGYDSLSDYLEDPYYMGATVGRYAGRIDRGTFELNGEVVRLDTNDGANTLHGGTAGLSTRVWRIDESEHGDRVRFTCRSPDGEQGFPGNLDVAVSYSLAAEQGLVIDFSASSDRATVINLANHAYFNLSGRGNSGDGHVVTIFADRYTALRDDLIPTGAFREVSGTPFDFREPSQLGQRLAALGGERGFDHNFVLHKSPGAFGKAAHVFAPDTGIVLELATTQPGLQFYTGDYLGSPFGRRSGFCLEAQNFPDAPNHPHFPTAVLLPGETYRQRTRYSFRNGFDDA